MLSIVGMIVAGDAFGPISDNAGGIAEQAGLDEEVLDITAKLDAAGNTSKAITKGFAIGAAGLTVIALLGAFQAIVQAETGVTINFDLMDPLVLTGALIGISIPAVFSAMVMLSVGKNAFIMIEEIRRQFREIPGLKEGKEGVKPDYASCVDIATKGALKELIPPSALSIGITLAVGFIGGIQALGGYHQKIHVLSEMNRTISCTIEKAQRELGYKPTIELEEGMRRSLAEVYEQAAD